MNRTHPKLLSDLEVFEKVIPVIDRTITIYGKTKFQELFQTLYYNEPYLRRRRELLETLLKDNKNKNIIVKHLKKIKKLENDINWLFTDDEKEYKDLCFKKEFFNIKEVISAKNFLKIYSPSFVIIVYLFIYMIFRYNGINISIKKYFLNIYNSYKMLISSILHMMMNNDNLISLITNLLATMYLVYQLYQVYNSVDGSFTHYEKCTNFKIKFQKIRQFIDHVKSIYIKDIFLSNEKKLIKEHLDAINKVFSIDKLSSIGSTVILKKTCAQHEEKFNTILQYLGIIDSFIATSKLLYEGFTFPQFDFSNKNGPYVDSIGMWTPYIDTYRQVLNDCSIGSPNTIILTGPNTAGKSTYIRNLMLSVLLSQTIGVTCCQQMLLTPFYSLFTYVDIPNIARTKESLFEAEIMRCIEYCQLVENLQENQYILTIMDELFTGTNPKEGIAGSYGVCEYLGQFKNNLMIITTHFHQLTNLENEYPDKFKNMKFYVNKRDDGSFHRPYTITNGVSNQNIAIDLLAQKGYNCQVVDRALSKLAELETFDNGLNHQTNYIDTNIDNVLHSMNNSYAIKKINTTNVVNDDDNILIGINNIDTRSEVISEYSPCLSIPLYNKNKLQLT